MVLFYKLRHVFTDFWPKTTYMIYTQLTFDEAIYTIVSSIEPGRVMSYSEVARAAGFPRHARMVTQALRRANRPLPWHRVIKSDRTLAFELGSEKYNKQKQLLEQDGVIIINGKAKPLQSDDEMDLDKLLWGPPEDQS